MMPWPQRATLAKHFCASAFSTVIGESTNARHKRFASSHLFALISFAQSKMLCFWQLPYRETERTIVKRNSDLRMDGSLLPPIVNPRSAFAAVEDLEFVALVGGEEGGD